MTEQPELRKSYRLLAFEQELYVSGWSPMADESGLDFVATLSSWKESSTVNGIRFPRKSCFIKGHVPLKTWVDYTTTNARGAVLGTIRRPKAHELLKYAHSTGQELNEFFTDSELTLVSDETKGPCALYYKSGFGFQAHTELMGGFWNLRNRCSEAKILRRTHQPIEGVYTKDGQLWAYIANLTNT